MLVVYFVNYFIVRYGQSIDVGRDVGEGMQQWNVLYGWRWMFGSEALPAFLLLVLLFFVPETTMAPPERQACAGDGRPDACQRSAAGSARTGGDRGCTLGGTSHDRAVVHQGPAAQC